ncbi:MAG: nickel pincer cofactor biosynthesis protein LarC [Acidobacteria bacterium]|nr:MAG: nickel pincer cofactor biosynthesis protein LarC [Acidobacteriota bacterium]
MLYLDCFSGASGDMILGALLDLGLPLDALKGALGSLAIEYGNVAADRVLRAGVSATKFRLVEHAASDPAQSDQHQHHHLKHIVAAIRRSALSKEGQDRAVHLFERLADAEAAIHHTPIERVHLHEVGALDSIIDIVGAVYGFEWFRIDDVMSSPLNVGGGTVRCAHGVFPVPAPATARLLAGVPVYSDGQSEMVTPTGALLVTGYAKQFGPLPAMSIEQIAYGAGERDPKERPNVLRILRGTRAAATSEGAERGEGAPASDRAGVWGRAPRDEDERIVKLESEIDDMNPQLFGPLMDALHTAGALDVFYTPVQMKKGRPGTLVTIIAFPERRQALTEILFRESTTIGVRYEEMSRTRLDRSIESVDTPYGPVRFKIARRGGEELNAAPEFDDCARLAAERGVSIKTVQAAAIKARLDGSAR